MIANNVKSVNSIKHNLGEYSKIMNVTNSIYNASVLGEYLAVLEWGMLYVREGEPCRLIWGKTVVEWYNKSFFDDSWFEWQHTTKETQTHLREAGIVENFPANIFISFQRIKDGRQERIYVSRSVVGNKAYCSFQAYLKEQLQKAAIKSKSTVLMA